MSHRSRSATPVDAFVGAQLKLLRKREKLSQTALGKQVGLTFQQVQKYERGANRIGASRLWDFCQVFGVQPGHFFDGLEAHLACLEAQQHNQNAEPPVQELIAAE